MSRDLNDSGENELARVFDGGAIHFSRGQQTSHHAHYAWKVHLGIDAPVWYRDARQEIRPEDGARVLWVPPNVQHQTGAVGWSLAIFIAPGTRTTRWRGDRAFTVISGAHASRVLDLTREFDPDRREDTTFFVDELVKLGVPQGSPNIDRRVLAVLRRLRANPSDGLVKLADTAGVSQDHLCRLISNQTGLTFRRHVLWSRLLRALCDTSSSGGLSEIAAAAGFADHAHMTRTYRAFLGRAPSEFAGPPDVLAPW